MLTAVLSPAARDRLARVALVKPDVARMVENYLLQSMRSRKMETQIGDDELVSILEQVQKQQAEMSGAAKKITITRKKRADDDDDDDDDDL